MQRYECDKSQLVVNDEGIPDEFICVITQELMQDPVIIESGHTFEREAIKEWFKLNNTCPKSRQVIHDTNLLIPNHTLRGMIIEWKEEEARKSVEQQNNEKEDVETLSESSLTFLRLQTNVNLLITLIGMIAKFIKEINLNNKIDHNFTMLQHMTAAQQLDKNIIDRKDVSDSDINEISDEYTKLKETITRFFYDVFAEEQGIAEENKEEFLAIFESFLNLNQCVENVQSYSELKEWMDIADTGKDSYAQLWDSLFEENLPIRSPSPSHHSPTMFARNNRNVMVTEQEDDLHDRLTSFESSGSCCVM